MGRKKALLVGCNYPGTGEFELSGCVNDVKRMHNSLVNRFGFSDNDITVLIDTDPAYTLPTGTNIRNALDNLVSKAQPGDILFFHFSGHGSRLPSAADDDDDDTGYDECTAPCDMNLIKDQEFRAFVDKVPPGCRITIVSDSCHSGGLIERTKEQIGNSTSDQRGTHNHTKRHSKTRSLPPSALVDILKEQTRKQDIHEKNLRATLYEVFGEQSGHEVENQRERGGFLRLFCSLLDWFLNKEEDERESGRFSSNGVLISGCQSHQTSEDVDSPGESSMAYGVLSDAIQRILAKSKGTISNRELVTRARKIISWRGFTQRPGLYCSDELVDAPFICECS